MSTIRRTLPPLAAALATAVAAPAAAPAQTVERTVVAGPSVDLAIGSNQRPTMDAAEDGTAAVAFLQKSGGVDRVYVARRNSTGWGPAEPIVTGNGNCDLRSTRPAVGVGNGGKVVVVFPAGNATDERLCAMIAPAGGAAFEPPTGGPVIQGDTPGWTEPEIDLAPNGDGYLVVHDATFGVFAQRLQGSTFAAVGGLFPAGKLNAELLGQAEPGDQRGARVAVSPDGSTATVAWTENEGGDYKLWARRLTGTALADIGTPVEGFVPVLEGRTGVRAFSDMASVAQGGGTTYVAFRQAVDIGGMNFGRLIARTFDGATFGPAQIIDGLPDPPAESGEYPRIAMNATGAGLAASYRQNTFFTEFATLSGGLWTRGTRASLLDSAAPGRGVAAISSAGPGLVSFFRRTSLSDEVAARLVGGAFNGTEVLLSDGALGPASAPVASGATATHGVTAFRQGAAATTRIVATTVTLDAPPAPPGGSGPAPPPSPGPVAPGGPAPLPGTPGANGAPRITKLAVVPSVFRRGRRNPVRTTKAPRTPRLRFMLDRDARVTLSAEKARGGRSVGGRCVAPTRSNRRRKACTRYVRIKGSKVISARRGLNHVRFEGRFSRKRVLSPGRYRLIAVARTASGGKSKASRARFRLLAPRRR